MIKQLISISALLLMCNIWAMDPDQDHCKENKNKTVQELLAANKIQQQQLPLRPPTPLNPDNNAHRPLIILLQTPDGRQVTTLDCYNYLGFYPTR